MDITIHASKDGGTHSGSYKDCTECQIAQMAAETMTPDAQCFCGYPNYPGVHRSDGPCHYLEPAFPEDEDVDMVNHPPHYTRGPLVNSLGKAERIIECIEVIRWIKDPRLFSAMKYVWRVAFGGKEGASDREDIQKAIWYLNDWLDHGVE